MISLKKHIESWTANVADDPGLKACRAIMTVAGKAGDRAVPGPDSRLEAKLTELARSLSPPVTGETLADVSQKAQSELSLWAETAFLRHQASENDLRQIIDVMAKAIASLTERDKVHAQEVGDLAEKLRSIAGTADLATISRALLETANSLTACVERIAEDGRQSLCRLSAEVEDYRTRLVTSERLSALDPLTGLANRRCFEEQLDAKIHATGRFCLILIDLNGFKEINDRYGHLAGDEVLKHFAEKLRIQFPSADLVARWGGDGFVVIISSGKKDAEARVLRISRSTFGECKISVENQPITLTVDASIGVVEWNGSENGREMLARADHYMYLGKESSRSEHAVRPRQSPELCR